MNLIRALERFDLNFIWNIIESYFQSDILTLPKIEVIAKKLQQVHRNDGRYDAIKLKNVIVWPLALLKTRTQI